MKWKKNLKHLHLHSNRGFTLVEILISLIVFMTIAALLATVVGQVLKLHDRVVATDRLQALKEKITEYYRTNFFMINSQQLENSWQFDAQHPDGNTYQTVAIPLPDGTYLYTEFRHQNAYDDPVINVNGTDIARVGNPSGLLYFVDNAYDGKMENFRVYITPLMADPTNRFHYRDIYLIWPEGHQRLRSRPEFDPATNRWNLRCDPSEYCIKIDGLLITSEIYNKMAERVENIGVKFRHYAEGKYASDPNKNLLKYYLSNKSNNNLDDNTCVPNTVDCYFASSSEISNTTLLGGQAEYQVDTPDGPYTISAAGTTLPDPANARFMPVYNVANIVSRTEGTVFGIPILYDNSSPNVRNPETLGLSNLGGYDAVLLGCVSDSDCIVYRIPQ